LLLWARPEGDIDQLLQQQWANAGNATLSAYAVSEHRLVILVFVQLADVYGTINFVH